MQRLGRMKHELSILKSATMTGISVWTVDDDLFHLEVRISAIVAVVVPFGGDNRS